MNNELFKYIKKKPFLFVLLAYFFITVAMTFPVITNMNQEIPKGRADMFQAMANIESRVSGLKAIEGIEGKTVFVAENINVYLPYVLVASVSNEYFAYNFWFLMSFILSAVGMYILAMFFTKNKAASFLAGLIYAFAPFHEYQSTVVNLGTMHQEWVPFLVYFAFKFFEKLKLRHFLGSIVFLFLIAMEEHQMLAFTVLFLLIFLVYQYIYNRAIFKQKKLWAYVATSAAVFAFIVFTMFGDFLKVATSENNFLNPGINAANKYSIAMLDPLVPPTFHSIWPSVGDWTQKLITSDNERSSYFLGFSVLGIIAFLFYAMKKGKISLDEKIKRSIYFWSSVAGIFYIFSLGPTGKIGEFTIYLPYYLIYKFFPFYENVRTTGRLFMFVVFAVSILFAYGYIEFVKKYKRETLIASIFTVVILLEFFMAPLKMTTVSHSSFYEKISQDGGTYALLEIPGSTSYDFASYAMITDSIHGKKVINGMPIARKIKDQFSMQQNTPVIKQLLYTIPKGNDPEAKEDNDVVGMFDFSKSTEVLNYYNIGYVTISKKYAKPAVVKLAENFIEKNIQFSDRYEDDFLIAYKVTNLQPKGFFYQLQPDNKQISDDFKGENERLYRGFGDGAALRVVNMGTAEKEVKITINAKSEIPMNLTVEGSKESFSLINSFKEYSFVHKLVPGENIVKFKITDNSGKPVAFDAKTKKHSSMVVSSINIEEK